MSVAGINEAASAIASQVLANLETLVRLESPTSEKAAVDAVIDELETQLRERGVEVERLPQLDYGDLLVARWEGVAGLRPIFVMTHVDTVWPLGTIQRLPWRLDGKTATGPGIYDMKASVAMMLASSDIVDQLNIRNRSIIWLINTEEEVGSPASRPLIESLAVESEYVLCLEPPVPPYGALKTQRKGVGMFTLEVFGQSSHAGADPTAGVNAIEELARQIQWLHSLSNAQDGTSVNVGVISGGTKRNVVAAYARAEIDLRVMRMDEARRIVPRILEANPTLSGAEIRVTGGLNRPPMERTPTIVAAFDRAREIASDLGLVLREGSTGGGSDGNFTAALGVATIDGLGCPGDGAHADHEHIDVAELTRRTALLAALLANL